MYVGKSFDPDDIRTTGLEMKAPAQSVAERRRSELIGRTTDKMPEAPMTEHERPPRASLENAGAKPGREGSVPTIQLAMTHILYGESPNRNLPLPHEGWRTRDGIMDDRFVG